MYTVRHMTLNVTLSVCLFVLWCLLSCECCSQSLSHKLISSSNTNANETQREFFNTYDPLESVIAVMISDMNPSGNSETEDSSTEPTAIQ